MGVEEKRKLKIKLLRPDEVWQPRLGPPKGSRNAAKAVPSLSMLRLRIRALRRRAKRLMAMAPP